MEFTPKQNHQEIEITLIICSERPDDVARQVAEINQIGNYLLLPQHLDKIRDLYLDTNYGALQKQKLSFRLREICGIYWLTLKGPAQLNEWGAKQRLEIEDIYSEKILAEIINELINRDIKIQPSDKNRDPIHQIESLHSLGFEIIQDRENNRIVRNVISPGEDNGKVLAELTVDSVVYHFKNQDIFHYEVEIEAKSKDSSNVLKSISESLIEIYGPVLRKWTPGKYVTGEAIEKLLRNGSLEGLRLIKRNCTHQPIIS